MTPILQFLAAMLVEAQPPGGRVFVDTVYPVLEKAECRLCHNHDGVSSATRLQFPAPDAKTEEIQAFGLRLSSLVNRDAPEQSLLLSKPTMRVAHTGGERIRKGSPEETVLRAWVDQLAHAPEADIRAAVQSLGATVQKGAKAVALRRLTHSQYNHTVRDLLGDLTRPADQFPQEDYLNGFTNQVEGQSIPPLLAEAYTVAAEKLAVNAFRRGDTQGLIPCKAASHDDAACRDKFLRHFGRRAFRRPLHDRELEGYRKLFQHGAADDRDFLSGARLSIEAMLQSPAFLFHQEDGGGRWPGYGAASKLSYLLWDTMPNEELFAAAETGRLETPDQIRGTARLMMSNPQTRRALDVFLAQWMRFDRVLGSARNVRRVPDFGPSLLAAMTEETRHLFNHLVWSDQNFMELFSAGYTFLSARLAQLYEMDAPPSDFGMVKYPPASTRAGVLGHAGFLTLTGNPNETSPTARGLFVREHFLCQNVPPPPPGVDTNLPASTAEKPMTNRQRLEVHLTNPSCASCHKLIDPIGGGLEGFDNIGRARAKFALTVQRQRDAVTNKPDPPQSFELPLDTAGHIEGIPGSGFKDARELGNILANDPTCQRCVVKLVYRYAIGRHEDSRDLEQIESLYEVFRESGFKFRDLLLEVVARYAAPR